MFLTLQEYLDGAYKLILKSKHPQLVDDEDAIAEVAHFMMVADQKFDGRGSKYGYRARYGHYGILQYMRKKVKLRKKFVNLSAFSNRQDKTDREEIFPATTHEEKPDSICEQDELVELILHNDVLTDREMDIITSRFFEGKTFQEIAEPYSVTKQRIEQIVKESIQKLRKRYAKLA